MLRVKTSDYNTVGKLLGRLMLHNNVSRYDVASKLGISSADMSDIIFDKMSISEEMLNVIGVYFNSINISSSAISEIYTLWNNFKEEYTSEKISSYLKDGYRLGIVEIDSGNYKCVYSYIDGDSINIYTERDGYSKAYFTHYKSIV